MSSNLSTGNLDELHNNINKIILKVTKQITFFFILSENFVVLTVTNFEKVGLYSTKAAGRISHRLGQHLGLRSSCNLPQR